MGWKLNPFGPGKARVENEKGEALEGPAGEPIEFSLDDLEALATPGPKAEARSEGDAGRTVQVPAEVAQAVTEMKGLIQSQAQQIEDLTAANAARAEADRKAAEAKVATDAKAWAGSVVKASKSLPVESAALEASYVAAATADATRAEGAPSLLATLKAGYESRTPHVMGRELIGAPAPKGSRALDNAAGNEDTPEMDLSGRVRSLIERQARNGDSTARAALARLNAEAAAAAR